VIYLIQGTYYHKILGAAMENLMGQGHGAPPIQMPDEESFNYLACITPTEKKLRPTRAC
jgi:hypothetical protein